MVIQQVLLIAPKWTLKVHTNKPGRTVNINLQGISTLHSAIDKTGHKIYTPGTPDKSDAFLYKMHLTDPTVGVQTPFVTDGKLQKYIFTMSADETERTLYITLNAQPKASASFITYSPRLTTTPAKEAKSTIDLNAPLTE
jgi:hypothetical protein